jgi:hypothetical protein
MWPLFECLFRILCCNSINNQDSGDVYNQMHDKAAGEVTFENIYPQN